MCDYASTCKRPTTFWVQSLLSTHNALTCSNHLTRTIREIEREAQKYDVMRRQDTADPDPRYSRDGYRTEGKSTLLVTKQESNYARVTVKPYTRRTHSPK